MRNATIARLHGPKMYAALAAMTLLAVLGNARGLESQISGKDQVHSKTDCAELRVIQGRITTTQGDLVTVKTPDRYPGGTGTHALFVIAGGSFKVNISHARVLFPDGEQADKQPLLIGDSVLMVLSGSDSASSVGPRSVNQTYFASTIERIVQRDGAAVH